MSDLLLTKLQVVEINDKDVRDVALLLIEHSLGHGPGDHIDAEYVAAAIGDDWGLCRTCLGTLSRIADLAPSVAERAATVRTVLESAPKSRSFRLRARIGERKRWYSIPDEVG